MASEKATIPMVSVIAIALVAADTSGGALPSSMASTGRSVSFVQAPSALASAPENVRLAWDPPADGDLTSYVIEAGSAPGLSDIAILDTGGRDTTLFIAAVPPGTYYVRVRARNAGGLSEPSNELIVRIGGGSISTPSACSTPPPPAGLGSVLNGSLVRLRWTESRGATSYRIEAGSRPAASDLYVGDVGTLTTFAATVSPGTYWVRIRASNGCGMSAPSDEITIDTRPRS
jgi:hypothetical protein